MAAAGGPESGDEDRADVHTDAQAPSPPEPAEAAPGEPAPEAPEAAAEPAPEAPEAAAEPAPEAPAGAAEPAPEAPAGPAPEAAAEPPAVAPPAEPAAAPAAPAPVAATPATPAPQQTAMPLSLRWRRFFHVGAFASALLSPVLYFVFFVARSSLGTHPLREALGFEAAMGLSAAASTILLLLGLRARGAFVETRELPTKRLLVLSALPTLICARYAAKGQSLVDDYLFDDEQVGDSLQRLRIVLQGTSESMLLTAAGLFFTGLTLAWLAFVAQHFLRCVDLAGLEAMSKQKPRESAWWDALPLLLGLGLAVTLHWAMPPEVLPTDVAVLMVVFVALLGALRARRVVHACEGRPGGLPPGAARAIAIARHAVPLAVLAMATSSLLIERGAMLGFATGESVEASQAERALKEIDQAIRFRPIFPALYALIAASIYPMLVGSATSKGDETTAPTVRTWGLALAALLALVVAWVTHEGGAHVAQADAFHRRFVATPRMALPYNRTHDPGLPMVPAVLVPRVGDLLFDDTHGTGKPRLFDGQSITRYMREQDQLPVRRINRASVALMVAADREAPASAIFAASNELARMGMPFDVALVYAAPGFPGSLDGEAGARVRGELGFVTVSTPKRRAGLDVPRLRVEGDAVLARASEHTPWRRVDGPPLHGHLVVEASPETTAGQLVAALAMVCCDDGCELAPPEPALTARR